MKGPNLELLRDVCRGTDKPIIASGGVSTLGRPARPGHPRVGRGGGRDRRQVLYAGAFTVAEAIAALKAAA